MVATEATRVDQAKSWQRLDGVDLLRGFAIFFVLMNHVNMQLLFARIHYTLGWPAWLVPALVWNGQYGVQMFFVVSGFLITATSLRRWGSLGAVRPLAFYGLRVARIAPLLLLLLAVLSVLDLAHAPEFVVHAKTGGLGHALLAALTFRINVLEATRGYLPGPWDILWSLSVEETFYLVFPLVCFMTRGGKWLVALLGVFVVLGPFGRTVWAAGNPVWHEYSYLGSMDAIALGCLTAIALSHWSPSRRQAWSMAASGAAAMLFVLLGSRWVYGWGIERRGLAMTVLALGACLVVGAAAQTRWRAPWLLSPAVWFGQHSYEVYLTHMFALLAVFAFYTRIGRPVGLATVLFPVVFLLAALLGGIVAHVYSEPANRSLRRCFGEGPRRMGVAKEDGKPLLESAQ
jgi:peptidoglycan/LPS O-acetylase OafA/YrhL